MPRPTPEDSARIEQLLADGHSAAEAMLEHDDFRAIIIGQTYIEAVVERLWKRQMVSPEAFNQTGFEKHVQLAVAVGEVPAYLVEPLLKLSAMRNVLAHHLGGHVKESAVRDLTAAVDRVTQTVLFDRNADNTPDTFHESVSAICEHARKRDSYGASRLSQDALFVRIVMLVIHVVLLEIYNGPPAVYPRARQQVLDEVLGVIDGHSYGTRTSNDPAAESG